MVKTSTWRDLKSFSYRERSCFETCHREDRVVDDVEVIKKFGIIGQASVQSFIHEDENNFHTTNKCTLDSVSIVIPFGDKTGDRFPLLLACVLRVRDVLPETEVVISDTFGSLDNENFRAKIPADIKILNNPCESSDFNIPIAVNKGVLESDGSIICILQADILIPNQIRGALKQFIGSNCDYWYPACGVFFLDRLSTKRYIGGYRRNLCAGSFVRELESYCLFIKRTAFMDVGGYYPEFTESAEDNDLYDRLANFSSVLQRTIALLHLWHPPYWKQKPEIAQRNRNLLKKQRELPVTLRIQQARDSLNAIMKETRRG